ncbi:hypothetical protein [Bacillus weihaiensis]|nr:hypothetical protein [Bacillus weihaiensis]
MVEVKTGTIHSMPFIMLGLTSTLTGGLSSILTANFSFLIK